LGELIGFVKLRVVRAAGAPASPAAHYGSPPLCPLTPLPPALVDQDGLRWLVFDCAAIEDIDYTASTALARIVELTRQRHVRFVLSGVLPPVRRQLDSYGRSPPRWPAR
jgi:hypothetical protein